MKIEINNIIPKMSNEKLGKSKNKKTNDKFNELLFDAKGKNTIKNDNKLNEHSDLEKISDSDLKSIKDELKKEGFSKEEVDKIEDVDDLKDFLKKAEDKGAVNSLLNIISLVLNVININSDNSANGANNSIEDFFKDMKNISKLLEKFINSKMPTEKQELSKEILEKIQSVLKSKETSNFHKSIIKTIYNKLFKSELGSKDALVNNMSPVEFELKSKLKNILTKVEGKENFKSQTTNIFNNNTIKTSLQSSKDSLLDGQGKNENKSENDFLAKFVDSDKKDSGEKIDKAVNFMSRFKTEDTGSLTAKGDIENVVLNKDTINTDMIKTIKYMQTNSIKELSVKIMPKELGEVIIKLTMEGGIMKAHINASNKDAYNILNNNLSQIQEKLQANNLKVQDISLNIYNEDTTFFKEGSNNSEDESNRQNNKNKETSSKIDSLEGSEAEENVSSLDSNVNMLA